MPHYFNQYALDDFQADGIKVYIDDVEITTPTEAPTGSVVKLKAFNGGEFYSVSIFDPIDFIDVQFTLGAGDTEATMTMPDWSGSLTYSGDFVPFPAKKTVLTISQSSIDTWAMDNMFMEVNGVPVVADQEINFDEEMTLRVTGNYELVYAKFLDVVELFEYSFVVDPSGKFGTLTLPDTVSFISSAMSYEVELVAPVNVKGSNTVYRIADADLETITHKRFSVTTAGATGTIYDYGQFILGFIKLPFEIDPSLIVGRESVRYGPLNIGVAGDVIGVDRLVVPLGSVSVPALEMNSLDYQSTLCKLHLPYANPVPIDIQYVIGETITIELSISLYDGEAQYTLKSSKFDEVFNTVTCKLDIAIPFANVIGGIPNKNRPSNVSVGVDNGIRTAFIEVERKPREMPDGFFTAAVNVEGTLQGKTGYFEVSHCELNVLATQEEKERILSALREGVILK
jgi:hypothetical protein